MAWTFRPISSGTTVASGDVTVNEPTGAANGDLLIACIGFRDSVDFGLPSGWTLIDEQISGNTFVDNSGGTSRASIKAAYIIRGSSAPDLTFTRTGGDVASGLCWGYAAGDFDAADPIGATVVSTNANSTTLQNTGVTTTLDDSLVVSCGAAGRDSGTQMTNFRATDPSTGSSGADTSDPATGAWQRFGHVNTGTGADLQYGVAHAIKATAGSTGNCLATSGLPSLNPLLTFVVNPPSGSTYTLTADSGSYTVTGTDANLEFGREVAAGAGSYLVTGTDANLEHGREVVADAGSYLISGTDAALEYGREITADAGAYLITGTDADLVYGSTYQLAAGAGAYLITGTDADLIYTPIQSDEEQPTGGAWRYWHDLVSRDLARRRAEERERLALTEPAQRKIDRAAVKIARRIAKEGLAAEPAAVMAAPAFDALLSTLRPTEGQVMALAQAIVDRIRWAAEANEADEAALVLALVAEL